RWRGVAAVLGMLAASHACAGPRVAERLDAIDGADHAALEDVVQSYEREVTPYVPFTASERGLREYDRVLANDISEDYRRGLRAICARHREALRRVEAEALSEPRRLTHDIFAHRLDGCLERLDLPWHLLPVNQAGLSWPSRFPIVGSGKGAHPFKTAQNYEDFLGRIDGFVAWVDTAIANMRTGMARGITQPRDVMLRVVPQLQAQIVSDPRTSVFYDPIRTFPDGIDGDRRRTLAEAYEDAITRKIVPAYTRLLAFIRDEYLPRCRTSVGLGEMPGGRAMYAHAVRAATTTSMTPDAIHDLGVAEVARIKAEMDRVRAAAAPAPPPTRYRSVAELLEGYTELRTSVEAALPKLFGHLPRAGFEIRAIEPFRERSVPSGYEAASPDGARPGVFYLNIAELRSSGQAAVHRHLFLHEALPGHHLQLSVQRENTALPAFRRFGWHTAFGEGWALYAEGLGVELGVYDTPGARLGMLHAELFRAARLVVDVGLHERRWTRAQAVEYLGGPGDDAEREVVRYMAWPAQALGYKIGQLAITRLRHEAERTLGPAFDVRAFHDELLRDGSMPLGILEAKLRRWIARHRR
ncbi:MAG: DUF885 domain-containing protein, partial [Candidatus Rokuibacteriota bacterium]